MWFAPSRPTRAEEAQMCRSCAVRGCPRRQAPERFESGDRRNVRAQAAHQYALTDTLQCPCLRPLGRGFLV